MKKILPSVIYFIACTISTQAQTLYGTTFNGGTGGGGTINKFIPATNTLIVIKSFISNDSTNGDTPGGSLIQASDGKLYGMTFGGGSNGVGVIFSFDPSSSSAKKLKDFDKINGANPWGSLIQANDGMLYGLTNNGGNNDMGVIFSFDPSSSTYTKLVDFKGDNGAHPSGSLLQASDGKLYGMTALGGIIAANGPDGYGVIFSFDPSTSTYTKVKELDYFDGIHPDGNLIQANDGKLYGMTSAGGNSGAGTIFSFDLSTAAYKKLMDFSYPNGLFAYGSFIQASDGKLYGMTFLGGIAPDDAASGSGNIFSFDPSSSIYSELKDFDEINDLANGGEPRGNLIQASDGKLYGMTTQGGSNNAGVIFSLDPSSSTYTKLIDYTGANGAIGGSPAGRNSCIGFIEVNECIARTFYQDADGDGYGNPDDSTLACIQPAGYVADNSDCDDTKASVHPGATEICGNGIDDNCNGQIDENCNIEPTVSINDVTVNESQGVANLTVTLSHASSKPVWLLYYTKDGTAVSRGRHKDFKAEFGLVFIKPGSLTGTISIKIFKDHIAESTEYFDVILWRSLRATIADNSGRVLISDDDRPSTSSKVEFVPGTEIASANSLEIRVMPNPSPTQFSLVLESNDKSGKIDMKVMDVQGKLIETRNNLSPGETLRIGGNYRQGTYFIHALQGKQRRTITVIKVSN